MKRSQLCHWKSYCSEPLDKIEHYEEALAEGFKGWCIHRRLEIQQDGTRVSAKELIDQGLYFGRPASELVFMRCGEHSTLHMLGNSFNKGKHRLSETRNKIGEALSSDNHPFFGKHRSDETRFKMSEANKGKHWYNNGDTSILAKTCPEGFVPGRIK